LIGRRGSTGCAQLVVVDVRTRRVHVVARRLGDGTAAWSPQGAPIAYAATAGESNASAIYAVNADGRGRRRLTPSWPPSSDASPVWSPDGKTLLFVRAPIGGGAERYVPEVWTMHADGSEQRPLTSAYPDGGENVEPAWIRGAVHAEVSPRPQEVRHGQAIVLRVPFPVDGIAAEGDHAAIAPVGYQMQRETQPTPPILLWHPGHRKPTRLVASPCGGVQQLVLTHNRLAFDCNDVYFDQLAQSLWVYDLRTRIPQEVFFGRGGGPGQPALYLDHIVGGDGLLAAEADESAQVRRDPASRGRIFDDPMDSLPELAMDLLSRIALQNPGFRLHHLPECPEADAVAVGERATLTPCQRPVRPSRRLPELGDEPRLADAGDAEDRHEGWRGL